MNFIAIRQFFWKKNLPITTIPMKWQLWQISSKFMAVFHIHLHQGFEWRGHLARSQWTALFHRYSFFFPDVSTVNSHRAIHCVLPPFQVESDSASQRGCQPDIQKRGKRKEREWKKKEMGMREGEWYLDRSEEANGSLNAIAACVSSCTPWSSPYHEAIDHGRVIPLKYLHILRQRRVSFSHILHSKPPHTCDSSVCHVRVNSTLSIPGRSCSASSGNRFVISKTQCVRSKGQIIHTTLRTSARSKCLKDDVCDTLWHQHISSDNSSGLTGWKQRPVGNDDIHRAKTSLTAKVWIEW